MKRTYTVAEIDALRWVCENRYLYGTANPDFSSGYGMSRTFNETEKIKAVEEMVRTHMLAGHTAEDLIERDNPAPKETADE